MDKEFIPYEQALALKELGFDEPCFGYCVDGELRGVNLGMEELGGKEPYYQRFGFHTLSNHNIDNPNKIVVTTPTFSQAFRWFRKKYQLFSWVKVEYEYGGTSYGLYITGVRQSDIANGPFTNYEEAESACLDKLIEIVKKEPHND